MITPADGATVVFVMRPVPVRTQYVTRDATPFVRRGRKNLFATFVAITERSTRIAVELFRLPASGSARKSQFALARQARCCAINPFPICRST